VTFGIDVRGRSFTLRVNYRTSHQIRLAADRLLPPSIRDVDGLEDDRTATVSVFNGAPPEVLIAASEMEEVEKVAAFIQAARADGIEAAAIGLFVRSRNELPRARAAVAKAGVEATELTGRSEGEAGRIALGTMHFAKGLEVDATTRALAQKGVKSFGMVVDVADATALTQWVEASAKELGGIDALVCNISALAVGDTPETWEKSFRTDMMHTVNAVTAALPHLEKSTCESVAIISSVSGFEVDFAAGSYGAIKAALIHYAKSLANQLATKNIRVNAVSPGNTCVEGGIWQNIERGMPDLYKTAMSLNPTGRLGTAEEVAVGVVFLRGSPLASRISGTNLIIDRALTKAV
jgi:NAD(P)-dependent dehydrogenase (short-subunit alcohol dehydrogenase family)